eukprot:g16363.t1
MIFRKSIAKEPEATVLLLDGFGCLGPRNYYTKGVDAALARAGAKVATVNVNISKPFVILDQVGHVLSEAGRFTACIILSLTSVDLDAEEEFAANMNFRQKLCAWVERGGRLIIRSERAIGNWPEWFGKTWKHDDYRRTTHECRAKFRDDVHWCKWHPEAEGAITTTINVKAVMMACVPTKEVLFGTTSSSPVSHSLVPTMRGLKVAEGLAAVALGKFGEGLVSFFGDVNAQETTCAIMAVIANGPCDDMWGTVGIR